MVLIKIGALDHLQDVQFLHGNDACAVQSALRWWRMDYY